RGIRWPPGECRSRARLPRLASMSTLGRGIARPSDMQILRSAHRTASIRRTRKVTRPGLLGGRFGTEPGGGTVSTVGRPYGLPTSFREIPRTRDTAKACCCRTRHQLHVGGLTAIILRLEREEAA